MKHLGVWTIDVAGYGSFEYVGTENEAEEMRRHKANWEGGVTKKRRLRDADSLELGVWNERGPYAAQAISREPRKSVRAKEGGA